MIAKANKILSLAVIVLGLYIVTMPFVPIAGLWVERFFDDTNGVHYRGVLASTEGISEKILAEPPEGKRLVLPSIEVDDAIIIGSDSSNLWKGIWHRPQTSTPPQGGNTVLVGHRYAYGENSSFYHLDKVKPGDLFSIWWDGTEYVYEVTSIKIVSPNAVEIEENTTDPIVTLYTCTPLWTAKQRLVIVGSLIDQGGL
jgi:LPXTG-site transpeptidase (sortase) family protein